MLGEFSSIFVQRPANTEQTASEDISTASRHGTVLFLCSMTIHPLRSQFCEPPFDKSEGGAGLENQTALAAIANAQVISSSDANKARTTELADVI